MIEMALRTQCKGFTEKRSDRVDVKKIVSNVSFETGPREVGESRCAVGMADRTLLQDQPEMLYSFVQVRDCRAEHVSGKLCMSRIRVSSNLTFNDGLQMVFCQRKLTEQCLVSLTSICAPS